VRISLDEELLAISDRCRVIFETRCHPAGTCPREDIQAELVESETVTGCAYKGFVSYSYYSLRIGAQIEQDIAWTYQAPRCDVASIAGMVAFFNERVDVELNGELQDRPLTPWSPHWPGPRSEGPPVISG
jgi:uncharacterized protein (DUF427 family)